MAADRRALPVRPVVFLISGSATFHKQYKLVVISALLFSSLPHSSSRPDVSVRKHQPEAAAQGRPRADLPNTHLPCVRSAPPSTARHRPRGCAWGGGGVTGE
ncbi:unnamed protein product [Pleuronectes platessa]|uniref:Uncharacterized protein n=1 Tax=Pleuronectes platessa TaxID=8262 RepID=A0A9N7U1S2_PLEPL|nr:unnamed protein product [Pleuronectes platessa]